MIKRTCPYGHKCKTTDNEGNVIEKCMFFIEMHERNVETTEIRVKEECAIAWTPILLLENARLMAEVRGTTESFRDEMLKSNEKASATMAAALIVGKQQLLDHNRNF
jgi:hypothetical protein